MAYSTEKQVISPAVKRHSRVPSGAQVGRIAPTFALKAIGAIFIVLLIKQEIWLMFI